MSNLDDELGQDYLADCEEHLAAMETELLAIKMNAEAFDSERLDRVFRATRAIGGPADFFGLEKIRALTYETENLVAGLCSRNQAPTAEQVRVLLSATEKLQEMFQNPRASNQANIVAVIAGLLQQRTDRPSMPLPSTHANAAGGLASVPALDAPPTAPATLRILLAEDDFACSLLLQTFLGRYGECHVAVNGKEAVDAYRTALDAGVPYHLICMDIMMPEMNGREAVTQVRAIEEAHGIHSTVGARIFMTTTVQEIKEVFLCFKELCDAYLMKPIELAQLLNQMKFYGLLK